MGLYSTEAESPPSRGRAAEGGSFLLALLLAALAGAVDAVGFVHWHGLFVSFMSGNSTTLGVAMAGTDWPAALVPAGVIGGFLAGVVAGELLGAAAGINARAAVLLVEAGLLTAAALATAQSAAELAIAPLLSVAMGVQNASVHRAGGISVALTYVTGTLVHVGRSVAAALRGGGPWSAALPYCGLWAALVGGSAAGALVAMRSETLALAAAAAAALLLAAAASFTTEKGAAR